MLEIIKKIWQKSWWSKTFLVIGAIFIWPFVVGLAVGQLLLRRVGNPLIKWAGVLPILFFSLLFNIAWIFVIVLPSPTKKGEQKVTELISSQSTSSPSAQTQQVQASTSAPKPASMAIESSVAVSPEPTSVTESQAPVTDVFEADNKREIVTGSTPKGIEFYKKVEKLHKQGLVHGELHTEYESDPIVDVNPEMQSVQLSLKYSSIIGVVDNQDKVLILDDFYTIKGLAEQDKGLVLPDFGTLRVFTLTFHDRSGRARGELEQLMIDEEPRWMDWK